MNAYLRKQLPRIFNSHLDGLQDVVDDSVIEEEREVESTEARSDSTHSTGVKVDTCSCPKDITSHNI